MTKVNEQDTSHLNADKWIFIAIGKGREKVSVKDRELGGMAMTKEWQWVEEEIK